MTSVTIEYEGGSVTVVNKDGGEFLPSLPEMLQLIEGALRGIGFYFNGTLTIEEPYEEKE